MIQNSFTMNIKFISINLLHRSTGILFVETWMKKAVTYFMHKEGKARYFEKLSYS